MEVADGWKTKGRDFGRMKIFGPQGGVALDETFDSFDGSKGFH